MKMNPFFSVIIPTYNRAKFIEKAIESVLSQSFEKFELIIVDDGSTDNTKEIVGQFTDNRIQYFHKENGERGAARNYGIAKSQGRYIAFLDSDDEFESEHLQSCYEELDGNEPKWCIHGFKKRGRVSTEISNTELTLKQLCYMSTVPPIAVKIRRDFMTENLFHESRDFILAEDLYVWLKMWAKTPPTLYSVNSAVMNVHEEQSMNNAPLMRWETSVRLLLESGKEQTFWEKNQKLFKILKASHYSLLALYFSLASEKKSSYKYLKLSLGINSAEIFRKRNLVTVANLILK